MEGFAGGYSLVGCGDMESGSGVGFCGWVLESGSGVGFCGWVLELGSGVGFWSRVSFVASSDRGTDRMKMGKIWTIGKGWGEILDGVV
jgi:hypothetical protein